MVQNVKKSAVITANGVKYRIEQLENNSIQITPPPEKNTKETLRQISDAINFEFDPKWNTQYFGWRLINFVNNEIPDEETERALNPFQQFTGFVKSFFSSKK